MSKGPLLEASETPCFSFVAANGDNEIISANSQGKNLFDIWGHTLHVGHPQQNQ